MKMTDLEHNIIKISTNISQLMQYWLNENNYSVTSVTKKYYAIIISYVIWYNLQKQGVGFIDKIVQKIEQHKENEHNFETFCKDYFNIQNPLNLLDLSLAYFQENNFDSKSFIEQNFEIILLNEIFPRIENLYGDNSPEKFKFLVQHLFNYMHHAVFDVTVDEFSKEEVLLFVSNKQAVSSFLKHITHDGHIVTLDEVKDIESFFRDGNNEEYKKYMDIFKKVFYKQFDMKKQKIIQNSK